MRHNCRARSRMSMPPRSTPTMRSQRASSRRKTRLRSRTCISPYANLIAVRARDRDQPWVKKLVAAYQSDDVRQFMKTEFKGSVVPSFQSAAIPGSKQQA